MTNVYEKLWIFAGVMLMAGVCQVNANRMYYHPGETQPVTVEAAIGADFNITCYMNPKAFPRKNSSCLYFVNGRTDVTLPRGNIVITNSTTILYMVRNASEQQMQYRCKCGSAAIMETKVFVGTPPRPVVDFACRSYDFEYMICNFTKPPNPILTTYNVSYYNDMPSYIFQPHCNYDDRTMVVCNTSLKDRYQEIYHYIIEASNALVKPNEPPLPQHFTVNNFEIMIPSRPGDNIRVESVTVDSIRFIFEMPNWEKYRTKGLQWEVLVKPENATVLVRDPPVREHNELRLRLNDLPYAFWRYDLKLRVRVKHSNAEWSEQLVFPFRTAARRPARAPLLQPGSFYVDSMETRVTIYWEELQPFEYNGDNFTYAIRSVRRDGNLIDLKPLHMELNLAIFPWQKYAHYEFEICSRNHVGDSFEANRLVIYPFTRKIPKNYTPKDIHNVYHANNRTYTLTWSKPKSSNGLLNYTVYWCYPKRALPNECRESMHFQQVPANQLNFTTEQQNALEEHTLNLAVSANYESFNTGLHWTDCTMDEKGDLVKMEPDVAPATTSIKVQWSVERVCPSILDGFNLTYCEVADNVSSENATCVGNPHSVSLGKSDKKFIIPALKPFTMYKLSIYMFSQYKNGKPSDPILTRTLEGAPSPPRQLKVFDITNTTANIKWMEPTQRNGRIRKYIIMLNNDKFEVNGSTLEYPLENLESFTSYKVYILAQTVDISDASNDVHFTTDIGYPSPPGQAPRSNNASVVQWSKPAKPRGRVEFYEVAITQKRNDEIVRQKISIIMGGDTSCAFTTLPTCLGAEYQTTVEVRAVNAALLTHKTSDDVIPPYTGNKHYSYYNDNNDDLVCDGGFRQTIENNDELKRYLDDSKYRLYKSPWQTSTIYSCSTSRMSKITTVALIVVGMSLCVMAALYMARKKYNKMANIKCTLPAGLETYFTKDGNGLPGDFGGPPEKPFESAIRAAEEQWISAARVPELNCRNEHHHLLSSLGNDSGYLGGNVCMGSDVMNGRALSSSLETNNVTEDCSESRDEDDEDYEKDHYKMPQHNACFTSNVCSSVDSLVESTEESESPHSDGEQSPLSVFPNSNGYIKQSMLQPWQNFHEEDNKVQPNINSGYISVQSLDAAANKAHTSSIPPPSSGYALQQDLQNFFKKSIAAVQQAALPPRGPISNDDSQMNEAVGGGGYTTLDDLSKLNVNSTATRLQAPPPQADNIQPQEDINSLADGSIVAQRVNNKTSNAAGGGGCISGYVTQQDLNIFAQHQQQY